MRILGLEYAKVEVDYGWNPQCPEFGSSSASMQSDHSFDRTRFAAEMDRGPIEPHSQCNPKAMRVSHGIVSNELEHSPCTANRRWKVLVT